MATPECGLYRTGAALAGREAAIGAGQLVYFHNHSKQGPPLVLTAVSNTANRWDFSDRGYLVSGEGAEAFLAALVALPREGFYAVTAAITLVDDRVLGPRSLVQVGYNRSGDPILFPAEHRGNGFVFSDHGFRFRDLAVFERLRECGFDAPIAEPPAHLLH